MNFLYCVGGTGARCMEALAYSLLAGCKLEKGLAVLSVDSDRANQNLTDAQGTMEKYIAVHEAMHSPLLSPQSVSGFAAAPVSLKKWITHPDKLSLLMGGQFSIKSLAEDQEDALMLLDTLYTKKEQAILPDDYGYMAHPNLGTAVLHACMLTTPSASGYFQFLTDIAACLNRGEEARVLILGSLFGGTGASSFPALAEDMRRFLRENAPDKEQKVHVGALMLTPYFQIQKDYDFQGEAIDPSLFDVATKRSLMYYAGYCQGKFDTVYVMGADPRHPVAQQAAGGANQHNPPMLLELEAAQACLHYFNAPISQVHGRLLYKYMDQTEDGSRLIQGWENVGCGREASLPLARMLQFSLVVLYFMEPKFQSFMRRGAPDFFTKLVRPYLATREGQEEFLRLRDLCAEYLNWFHTLSVQEEVCQEFVNAAALERLWQGVWRRDPEKPAKKQQEGAETFGRLNRRRLFSRRPPDKLAADACLIRMRSMNDIFEKMTRFTTAETQPKERFEAFLHFAYQVCCK